MASQVVRIDGLRSVAHGSITTSYAAVGSIFAHPMRMIRFINATNGDLLVSFDAVNDNMFIPAGSFVLYDITTNREENILFFVFSPGSQVFVKYSTAPSSGAFYVECLYGKGE